MIACDLTLLSKQMIVQFVCFIVFLKYIFSILPLVLCTEMGPFINFQFFKGRNIG